MADTTSIIASVEEPGAAPGSPRAPRAPRSPTSSSTMSTSLRRIFSPASTGAKAAAAGAGAADDDDQEDDDSLSTCPPRRRFLSRLCACLAPRPADEDMPVSIADFHAQLSQLEPTYEPEGPLLPDAAPEYADRPCLVLDLDETLVHSSFTPIDGADFEIPLDMQGETHTVFVKKRPGVDDFLAACAETWEVIIFTASLSLYADPVMELLDPGGLCCDRLYREHCVLVGGCYVKDIAKLGRDLKRTLIVDNSPLSYALQPENAVPIEAFFTDPDDRELDKTLLLLNKAASLKDVRHCFKQHQQQQT
jgi:carboxy-terminal domain RNA polymerase II polypeptide A small phosphatase